MKITKIVETALYVDSIEKAEKFYTEVLEFEKIEGTPERDLFLRCGTSALILFNPDKTKIDGGGVPVHGAFGQGHIAFGIAEEEFSHWTDRLAKHGVAIEKIVDWGEGIHSLYFRDPSGNSLEFISENCYR
jgi:catechol 2,3-dioxygenase-like lactoylglutathione lyase family enzyme